MHARAIDGGSGGARRARALEEAKALGLNDRLRRWALDYLRTHPR